MLELELKAVVDDPEALREHLGGGAAAVFVGRMLDRYYDHGGSLAARGEVVRVRRTIPVDGEPREELAWKGPTHLHEGYKARREIELGLSPGASGGAFLTALGYQPIRAVDRHVEVHRLHGGVARLEWYPRMDTLIEVEGDAGAIEAIIRATGLPRSAFRADPLAAFEAEYQARTGSPALLSLDHPDETPAHWPS